MNKLRQTAAGGGKLLSLAALATIVLGCAAPAHADSISVDLDTTNVTLQRSGNLYKHNSSVSVHNSNDYGFTLNLDTNQPDLVNNRDSTYRINSVTGYYKYLAANQWGYGIGSDATSFNPVSNATLADVTKNNNGDCYSISDCTIYLTFGANIEPQEGASGYYSTTLTYIATSKPAPDWNSICRIRYYGDGAGVSDKRSYCAQHQGDMSGYWGEKCSEEYSDDSDKESYCASHDGDMSGYQPDWSVICRDRYYSDYNKQSYCESHDGDMSGYWGEKCREEYSNDSDKQSYCASHDGDMSGYPNSAVGPWMPPVQPPKPKIITVTLSEICKRDYPGSDAESEDKYDYCCRNNGDMQWYRPNWDTICNRKYYGYGSNARNLYCKAHNGDMSGYNPDMESICRARYPGYGNSAQLYCIGHGGNMIGYHP